MSQPAASAWLLAALLLAAPAFAEVDPPHSADAVPLAPEPLAEASPGAKRPTRLGYRVGVDGPVTVGAWALWIGSETFKAKLAPSSCRICTPNSTDRAVRNALVWSEPGPARLASDLMLYAGVPLAALGTTLGLAYRDGKMDEALWDVLLVLEAAGLAALLTQSVKFVAARERPFVHYLPEEEKARYGQSGDSNLAFYSGHASFTFALAAATATVARMRGREGANLAWAVGLPLAAATAYLRIAGDKHYLSDVAVGALVGVAVGMAVPAVHDWEAFRGHPVRLSLVPVPGGASGALVGHW